tara:strand:- start:360 stop:860 length:501 start_codon:yes stop_codon:yes gene_type:complete
MAVYGSITDVLNTWADAGVFAYVLPFLMIFAVVYGLLHSSKILGDNKGVHATIALAIGLLSLQFDYVSNFFAIIFPYFGMGLAVLLVALILMGFVGSEKSTKWVWFTIGLIIFLVVVLNALSDFSWFGGGYIWQDYWPAVLAAIIIVGLMALIMFGDKLGGKTDKG